MNSENLLQITGEIDEAYITEALEQASGAEKTAQKKRGGKILKLSLGLAAAAALAAGDVAHPEQPDNEHIQHDECLPHVEVGKLKELEVPLAEEKQADHAQQVDGLHGEKAQARPIEALTPCRGEGENGCNEHDGGFHAVAAGLNGYTKVC